VSREKVKDKRKKGMNDLPIQDNQCLLKDMYGRGERSTRKTERLEVS
jgi:hypothetical protein